MGRSPSRRSRLAYAAAVLWLVLTVSLASWWLIFGLGQASRLGSLAGPEASELGRVRRMLVWEGTVLIALVCTGGVVLLVAIRREQARRAAVETFFMAFTHDLKTSLASLVLQAESLREDVPEAARSPNLDRLMKDALRLQLQLENSLYLAQPDGRLLLEPVDIRALVTRVAVDWPEIAVRVDGDARVRADERALASVVRNLLQNSAVHGRASTVEVRVRRRAHDTADVAIEIVDDGRGGGAPSAQGRPGGVGSGVGLQVSARLVARMDGTLSFGPRASGFAATLTLPAAGAAR